eukprot:CAMPEP_0182878298 /NCGR_PEP_ID=MMETSP0034_2-20130328/15273_1 /TAXON_ID=156128 /ORGANISM="Nephroselmis pyriformis, Strain CCMP717" /LENGTH=128 /DNA_ID=CAMNT_0025011179 /DNA_START=88 /DNA_END=471 /DNA_ORIENTATION=-
MPSERLVNEEEWMEHAGGLLLENSFLLAEDFQIIRNNRAVLVFAKGYNEMMEELKLPPCEMRWTSFAHRMRCEVTGMRGTRGLPLKWRTKSRWPLSGMEEATVDAIECYMHDDSDVGAVEPPNPAEES